MTAEALALPNGTTMDEPTQSVNDRKKRRSRAGTLVAIIVVALGVVAWWWLGRGRVSTDNAFIQADIVQLSPRINGTVAEVLVDENDWVEAGQPLLRLDPVDYDVQVDQARAAVATARAQLETAAADLDLTREQSEAGVLQAEAVLRAAQSEASRAAKDAQRYRDLLAKDEIARQQVHLSRFDVLLDETHHRFHSFFRQMEDLARTRSGHALVGLILHAVAIATVAR